MRVEKIYLKIYKMRNGFIKTYGKDLYNKIEKEKEVSLVVLKGKPEFFGKIKNLWLPADGPHRKNDLWFVEWYNGSTGIVELNNLIMPINNKAVILDKYKIIYKNGFVQYKNLISHNDYLSIIKPLKHEIWNLEIDKKLSKVDKAKKINELKSVISDYGSFFTDKSPLFYAIETGILELTKNQGGKHKIELIKL